MDQIKRTGFRRPFWSRLQKNDPASRFLRAENRDTDAAIVLFPHPATPYSQKSLDVLAWSPTQATMSSITDSRVPDKQGLRSVNELVGGGAILANSSRSSLELSCARKASIALCKATVSFLMSSKNASAMTLLY